MTESAKDITGLRVERIDDNAYRVYEDTLIDQVWDSKGLNLPNMIDGINHQILRDVFETFFEAEIPCTCCNTPLTNLASRMRRQGPICHAEECLKIKWVEQRDRLLRDSSSGRTTARQAVDSGSTPESRTNILSGGQAH